MAGIVITGTDTDGIVLSDPATDDPATVAATGYITNQTATHDYDAIYGAPGYSWTVANLGTIGQLGLYGAGIHLTGGGFVTNGESGSNTGWITGNVPVYIQGGSGMVTNFGTLRAEGGSGVYLEAGGSVVNGESGSTGGLIQGGVFITGDSSGTVTNFGLISAYGGGIGISADSGTVVNFGTINGLSFDDWFQGHGVILGHGSVTNGQSGSITGDETGVRVIDSTVTNFGSIIGGTGYGVAPEAGGSVVNFGTIEGGSIGVFYVDGYGSGLPGTVTNAGTIIGDGGTAVQFGIANDRLVVDPGAVFVGTVDGGAGSDVLELTTGIGSRTLSGLGTSFANFETVVFDADAVWTVTLDNPAAFTGTISGFTAGDILDLIGRAATGVTYAGGVLTVQNGGTVVAALNLAGSYTSADFSIGPDGHGGTAIGIADSQYVFFAPGQTMNVGATTDPNNPPPPVSGDFNLELVLNATGTGSYMTAPGYQGLAIRSADGHTLTMLHGDYGAVDNGAGNTIFLGDGSESIGGAIGDTIQGGSGPNQFLDGHLGHQSIIGGTAGNETIWGAATDTVRGGTGGNETIAGVAGETIFGSNGANVFINATGGNQSVLGGSAGNDSIWTGAGDTIHGGSNNETIGGVAGVMMIGGSGGDEFLDASQGHQSVLGGSGGNETIWGAATDTITGGSGGNETIGGVAGETILGGSGANIFINATDGSQSIIGGTAGNMTVWSGAGDTIRGGSDNETIGGVPNDTVIGGNGGNQFIDGSQGHQSILGGSGGNETIWGAATDTITGGSGGNETIGGVSGETILGGAANTFINATGGSDSIVAGTGNTTVWGGAHDTVQGTSGSGTALIGFAGGNETFWDDGMTTGRQDSISTFNQAGGDRISLNGATDDPNTVVATATKDGGNAVLHLHDGSSITLIGITTAQLTNGYFTMH